jgi:hypothetical protein
MKLLAAFVLGTALLAHAEPLPVVQLKNGNSHEP